MTKYTYRIRRAIQADIFILTELRMAFLRDFAGQTGREVPADLEKATQDFLAAAVPKNEFIAWLAVSEDGQIVGSSGLVFFQRAPTAGNLSGLEAYVPSPCIRRQAGAVRGVATALLKDTIDYVRVHAGAARIPTCG